jgi:hypothetical protein
MTPLQIFGVALLLAVLLPLVLVASVFSWLRYRYGLWRLRRFHMAARREWARSRR